MSVNQKVNYTFNILLFTPNILQEYNFYLIYLYRTVPIIWVLIILVDY